MANEPSQRVLYDGGRRINDVVEGLIEFEDMGKKRSAAFDDCVGL
jgi:hypothetical protein